MTTAQSAGGGEGFCSHLRTPTHRRCALHAAPPDIAVERELRGLNRERWGGVLDLLVSPQCRRSRPSAGARERRRRGSRLATAAPWARRACRHSPRKPRPSPLVGLRATALLAPRAVDPGRSRTRRSPRSARSWLMLAQCRSWIGWGDKSGWWAYRAGWWEPGWFGLASWWAGWVGWVLGVE